MYLVYSAIRCYVVNMSSSIEAAEKERKLAIARRIASGLLDKQPSTTNTATKKEDDQNTPSGNVVAALPQKTEDMLAERDARFRRSMKLILSNKSKYVYNMDIEQQLITERNFALLFNELEKMSKMDGVRMASLVELLTNYLEVFQYLCD